MESHVAITVFLIALSQRCPRVYFLTKSLFFPEDDKEKQLKSTQKLKTKPDRPNCNVHMQMHYGTDWRWLLMVVCYVSISLRQH